jgi:carboxyl-terminal processing protease
MRRTLAFALFVAAGCSSPAKPAPAGPAPAPAQAPAPAVVAPAPKPPEPPKDPRVAADLASFDKVWQTIQDTFYDPKLGGLDWKAIRAELRPKVEASKDREETRKVLQDLVHRLGKSHFGVWAPYGDAKASGDGDIGLDVRIVDGVAIILRMEPGSPGAQTKSLRAGLQLAKVDDVDVAAKLAAVATAMPGSSLVPLMQARAVEAMLRGKDGTPVRLGMMNDATSKLFEVSVTRKPPAGRLVSLGNLGPEPLVYESKWLDKTVGYIRLSIFLDPATVVPAIAKDLAGFAKARGVIIDLRGNPGGIGGMATGIAGYLVSEENKKLGTMRTRQASLDFVINPQPDRYTGAVAILVDEQSASTSEIFAGGMADIGRAKVLGRQTPGAALPSVIETLPNGDRFQYAIADYVSASGAVLEGKGVVPGVPVRLDAKALRSGTDPDIVAATRWIAEVTKEKKP